MILQDKIERIIAHVHQIAPGSVGDLFQFALISCDETERVFCFRCQTEAWMKNAMGTLHGGISATIMDQAMGMVVSCVTPEEGFSPTIQMQECYHRPIFPGDVLRVIIKVTSQTKSMINLNAELYRESMLDSLCVSGTAIYYCRAPVKK